MSGMCCVTNCRKRLERSKRNVKSFSFPNDVKRRKQWIQAVQSVQKNWIPSSFNRICNDHFKKTDFFTSDKSNELLLKSSAVPTVFTASDDMEDKERKTRTIKHETIKDENDATYTDADMIEDTTEITPNVIEEYIIEEDPLHGNTEYKFAATSSKYYGQEEASDSDEDAAVANMETETDDTSLTLKLSKLISEENISSSCAEKLLSILKQHGHAELPKKTDELPSDLVEPENEEIEHMNKVLDYVAAEAKDIEAKIQFKLNFLSKCLNRIECKMQVMAARPMDSAGGHDIFSGSFMNVFPIETMEKLTELEEKIDEDDELEAKVRSIISSNPRTWLKHMFSDDIMEKFNLNGSGNKGNFMELRIIKCIEKYVSRGDILHQKRQCKDRYRKGKLYKQRRMENEIY